jgi:hypothetical protein
VTVAALVAFSALRLLHMASADALLPVLMSTERLTWFYWGQDRLANLVPLLAAGVQQPRLNLGVQMVIVATGWYGLIAAFAAHHLRVRRLPSEPGIIAGCALASGLIAAWALPAYTEYVFVFEQLYAFAALVLIGGVVGLLDSRRSRQVGGFTLVLAATMVNPAITLCIPLILAVSPRLTLRAAARALCSGAFALVLTMIASRAFGTGDASDAYNDFALDRTIDNFWPAIQGVTANAGWSRTGLLLGCAFGILLVCNRARGGWRVIWGAVMIAAFGVAWTALFSGNEWVAINALNFRYFFPIVAAGLFVVTSATTECSVRAVTLARRHWRVHAPKSPAPRAAWPAVQRVFACSALAAAPVTIWLVSRVSVDSLVAAEPRVDQLADDGIRFVAGDYWSVWPTVLEGRAQGLTVWGLLFRGEATLPQARSALADEVRQHGSARVMCLQVDAQGCLNSIRSWTELPLNLVSQVSSAPVVIVVQ